MRAAARARGICRRHAIAAAALVCLALPIGHGALGKDDKSKDDKSDCGRAQDCALDALKSGQIRPLSDVLAVARDKLPGDVVKIELEREDGVWVYEIKVLTPSGKRREIEIDARTLAVIKID